MKIRSMAVAALLGAAPCLGSLSAQATHATASRAVATHAAWTRTATIYEVNVRQYSAAGTLAAVQASLPRLKAMGVDIIWLMPLQPIGEKNRKGPLGSYYSVRDYRAINPEFGTTADAKALINAAHRLGLKVILDWVPNHTAFDHPWITAHPDWYVHGKDGQIINARDGENHDTDWTDVAELDYDNRAMRAAMLADMRWWLTEMKLDGFRCDVAGGAPQDFWTEARVALGKVKSDLFMLAEAEGPAFHPAFDMTYGWEFHHLLNDVAQGKQPATAITSYVAKDMARYPTDAYRMYFTSNHDENSWNGTEFERMGKNAQASFVVAATLAGGMPLVYTGQEAGLDRRLKFFEKDAVDFSSLPYEGFYRETLTLKHRVPALANGARGGAHEPLAHDAGDRVLAFARSARGSTVVVIANFGDAEATVSYRGFAHAGWYRDWYGKSPQELPAQGAVRVPAHGWKVFVKN